MSALVISLIACFLFQLFLEYSDEISSWWLEFLLKFVQDEDRANEMRSDQLETEGKCRKIVNSFWATKSCFPDIMHLGQLKLGVCFRTHIICDVRGNAMAAYGLPDASSALLKKYDATKSEPLSPGDIIVIAPATASGQRPHRFRVIEKEEDGLVHFEVPPGSLFEQLKPRPVAQVLGKVVAISKPKQK